MVKLKTKDFKKNSIDALNSKKIQNALKGLYKGFHSARIDATKETPNWDDLSSKGRGIKAHTIENLDYYLEKVESMVTRSGGKDRKSTRLNSSHW